MKKTQKNTARAILIRSIVIVPLVATKVIWIKPSSFRNNTISVSVIMFVVASAVKSIICNFSSARVGYSSYSFFIMPSWKTLFGFGSLYSTYSSS